MGAACRRHCASLAKRTGALLSREDVSAYRELDPGNARLRNLVHDMLDSEAWRLLWIPPSWPYYEPEGEFAQPGAQGLTKRLIFSSWQVVPKVVAALMTYEAERRMLGIEARRRARQPGAEARKKRRGLLRFGVADERLTGCRCWACCIRRSSSQRGRPAGVGPATPGAATDVGGNAGERARYVCSAS